MKKLLMVTVLGLAGAAGAQSVSLNGAVSFTGGTGLFVGVTANDVTSLGGLGVSARAAGDFARGASALNLDAFVTLPAGGINLYVGPGVAIGLNGGGTSVQVTGGAAFPVADQLDLFAEAGFRFNGNGVFRAGINYTF
ncbi:hypothetical protein [Deinococcus pimensis]|uniref:hypothetical protein n=1 Tax=Deinococcus pimensis TaxID=309888 RepID=UPI0005EB40F3|nr:hypothetical protein [Deinococcus pimensis]